MLQWRFESLGVLQAQETGDAHEDEGADTAKGQRSSFLTGI